MSDRDDFSELVASARNVIKCPSFNFYGRIRYGTKGDRCEDKFLCMDAVRVYICSVKIPVKIESQFNILSIKSIERSSDSHVIIETDIKPSHSLYGFHDKASLQPFLIILIRTIRTIFPHRLQSSIEIRPENEYERLLRLSNEYFNDKLNDTNICGGFSIRYACTCDFYQTQLYQQIQDLVDTVFAHRLSREFTFREFESYNQKDWLPIIGALRHNDWFLKLTIENAKLSAECVDELCAVLRLNKIMKDLCLSNCSLKQDFCARFAPFLPIACIENIDLSNNPFEDKGLNTLSSTLAQRKLPLRSINLQSCALTHKSLSFFNTCLAQNICISKSLKILNISGNRIKDENCVTVLFTNPENVLEELHISDLEFSLDSFFNSLSSLSCKIRRLFITSVKSSSPSIIAGAIKLFFTKIQTLEILQISNANLSIEFLRELCDGLHSNTYLKNLDLRLSGNQLESFIREYGFRLATIPCLTDLDISACDLDNEALTLLVELKKNRKLKSLLMGKNFNNIKPKNLLKTINALRDLILESKLEFLSVADLRLRENTPDILQAFTINTSIKTLDIRGNSMGDAGVRALTRVLQTNRHLTTIYYDRNVLSLTNFEDIVNALEENNVIQYLPVPITDIILMKTSERERMEKLQSLMIKLDSLCLRNQQQDENWSTKDFCLVKTAANLADQLTISWDNQQRLLGDQISLEYIQSCTNREANKNDEIESILTRPVQINQAATELYNLYLTEESRIRDEWNDMCTLFEQNLLKTKENLSKKSYQLFKDQSLVYPDDKLQEEIRRHAINSNNNIHDLLNTDMLARIGKSTREWYVDTATCLQRRAYDTMNHKATEIHKQMESTILQIAAPSPQSSSADGQQHTPTSTLDRLVNRGAQVVHRIAHKHNHSQPDVTDEAITNRTIKQNDSNEYITPNRLLATTSTRSPAPPPATSPKPPLRVNHRQTVLVTAHEQESSSTYNNFPVLNRLKKQDSSLDDDGDRIENDLLNIIEEEKRRDQQKNITATESSKKRTTVLVEGDDLHMEVEPTTKLVHLAKDRPRRENVRRPVKKAGDGTSHDSSSDGGLDNDDNSLEDIPSTPTTETTNQSSSNHHITVSAIDPPTADLPPKTMTKIKSALKPTKATNEEQLPSQPQPQPPPVPVKNLQRTPSLQARVSPSQQQIITPSKSTLPSYNDSPQIVNSDLIHDSSQVKSSLPIGVPGASLSNNRDDQSEAATSSDNISSQAPQVPNRTGRAAPGFRVLPPLDPNGEVPIVKLRHNPLVKKENPIGSDNASGTGDSPISVDSDHFKRLSVKERANMITRNISPMTSSDKKTTTPTSSTTVTSPYTPRAARRIVEQMNLLF